MRIPLAPARRLRWTACFMARRCATRRSSCWATFSATSCASRSGRRISCTFSWTSLPVSSTSSLRRASIPVPPRPMMIPGRAACTVIFTALDCRSISIRGIPARYSFSLMYLRIRRSSCR